ncbi:hypothetical protein DFH09DRAFT_1088525 [Mycena vulgaris]|nr:hypothetical protein DFH09DRAFT_1088525 [Mycena vulgaris]
MSDSAQADGEPAVPPEIVIDADGFAVCPLCKIRRNWGPGGVENLRKRHMGTNVCKTEMAKLMKKSVKPLKETKISQALRALTNGRAGVEKYISGQFLEPRYIIMVPSRRASLPSDRYGKWAHACSLASSSRRPPASPPVVPQGSPRLSRSRLPQAPRTHVHDPALLNPRFVALVPTSSASRIYSALCLPLSSCFPLLSPALAFASAAVLSRFGHPALVLVSSQVGFPQAAITEVGVRECSRCTPTVPATVLFSGLFPSPAITPSQAPLISRVLPSSKLESQNFLLLTSVPMGFPDPHYSQAPQITVVKVECTAPREDPERATREWLDHKPSMYERAGMRYQTRRLRCADHSSKDKKCILSE